MTSAFLGHAAGQGELFGDSFAILSTFTPQPKVAKCGLNACGRCRCCLVSSKLQKCAFRLGESAVLTRSRGAMLNYPHVLRAFRGSGPQSNSATPSQGKSESYVYADRWISTSQLKARPPSYEYNAKLAPRQGRRSRESTLRQAKWTPRWHRGGPRCGLAALQNA